MICQNCQSTDIVSIQGQNYCINCGQIVVANAKPAATPKPADLAVKILPLAEIPKTTAGKAAALKPMPLAAKVAAAPIVVAAISKQSVEATPAKKSLAKTNQIKKSKGPASPKAKSHPTATKVDAPKMPTTDPIQPKPASAAPKTLPKQLSDLRPAAGHSIQTAHQSAPVKPISLPLPSVFATPAVKHEQPTTSAITQPSPLAAKISSEHLSAAITIAWQRANSWQFLKLGFPAALLALIPAILLIIENQGSLDFSQLSLARLPVAYLAAIFGYHLALYVVSILIGNSVIYGSAKLTDNRSTNFQKWWMAAFNSLWKVIGLDVAILVLIKMVVVAEIGLNSLVPFIHPDEFTRIVIARVLIGLAGYLVLSLISIRQLARNAVVVAGWGVISSLDLALKLWRRQTALVLGAAVAFIALAISTLILYGAFVFGFKIGLDNFHLILPLWANLLFATTLGLILVSLFKTFGWTFWQSVYRLCVRRSEASRQSILLNGRAAERGNILAKTIFWASTLALVVLTGFLAWSMPQIARLLMP